MTDKTSDTPFAGESRPGPRRPFPTAGDLLAMLGIVLGVQIAVGAIMALAGLFAGAVPEEMDPERRGALLALTYAASMLPAYLLVLQYRRARGGRGPVGRFGLAGLNPVLLAWAFLFMMAAGVVCEPLFALLPEPQNTDLGRGVWTLLSVLVAAPVLEELLCRGVVLEAVRSRWGVVAAWLLSSLFFGVLHGQPMLVVNAFVIGLILGYICIVARSLWASMILHALNNGAAYVLMVVGWDGRSLAEAVGSRTLYIALYICALAVTALSARMVWRTLRRLRAGHENEPDMQ